MLWLAACASPDLVPDAPTCLTTQLVAHYSTTNIDRTDLLFVIDDSPSMIEEQAAIRRAIELSATKYCPVNAMLSAGATEVHHRFVVRSTGPEPFADEGEVVVTGPYRRPDVVA